MEPLALPLPVVRSLLVGWLALGLLAVASPSAQAQIFSCKDAKGRTLTSDRPITECAGAVRELREDGATRREIAAPLTPEQRRLKEQEDAKAQTLAQHKREQALRDKALLMAYSSLASLEQMRSRQLAELSVEIKAGQQRLIAMHKELLEAQAQVRAQPTLTTRTLVRNKAQAMLSEDELIRSHQDALAKVREKFDQDAKRLRELMDPPASSGS
jgi:hypothetical protein